MEAKRYHILLVEDEEAHAELTREALESGGAKFRVTVAGSLEEANAVLAESDVDLAIVDWSLPDGKGSELLPGSLDAATLPIVIMTARGDERLAVEAMKAGALDYVVKSPETLSDMGHIAERSLREWEHIAERKRAEEERERLVTELQKALEDVKTLRGIVPICAGCKKIRDDKGFWQQVEIYVREHSEVKFTHGMCPECLDNLRQDFPHQK